MYKVYLKFTFSTYKYTVYVGILTGFDSITVHRRPLHYHKHNVIHYRLVHCLALCGYISPSGRWKSVHAHQERYAMTLTCRRLLLTIMIVLPRGPNSVFVYVDLTNFAGWPLRFDLPGLHG